MHARACLDNGGAAQPPCARRRQQAKQVQPPCAPVRPLHPFSSSSSSSAAGWRVPHAAVARGRGAVVQAAGTGKAGGGSGGSEGLLLGWSPTEGADEGGAHDSAAQQQQQRGRRAGRPTTAQPPPPPPLAQKQRRQPRHAGAGEQPAQDAPSRGGGRQPAATGAGASSTSPSSCSSSTSSSSEAAYLEAQQRVRAILGAADIGDPAAAARLLPDGVNELVIALQVLATARRPASLVAQRAYNAAVQQAAAAVLHKYKQLLLRMASQQQQQQQQQPEQQPEQEQLAAALAALPPTKVAATAFSLGALRQYDTQVVPALESASLLLLRRGAFKANQLGQLVQGFGYLDHTPGPEWQLGFREAARDQMRFMQGPQLASLAVWITGQTCAGSSSGGSSSSTDMPAGAGAAAIPDASSSSSSSSSSSEALIVPVAASAATAAPVHLDAAWVLAYLKAVRRHAGNLRPAQLPQVLHAAAALYQQHAWHTQQQQQQQDEGGAAGRAAGVHGSALEPASTTAFAGLPLNLSLAGDTAGMGQPQQQQRQQQVQRNRAARSRSGASTPSRHSDESSNGDGGGGGGSPGRLYNGGQDRSSSSSSSSSSSGSESSSSSHAGASAWLLPLLAAFQAELPELKMAHLAEALPALAQLTARPWPPQQPLLRPLLLQVRLLLPGCSGADLVAVVRAAAALAGPAALAEQREWCDAAITRLHAVLPALGPAGLAGAVQALAALRVRPYGAWVYALCQRLRVDARAMDEAQVLAVLEGLAALGVVLDPEVLHLLVLGLRRCMGRLGRRDLDRAARALRAMYPRALPGRGVQQLVEEMQRRAELLALQEQRQQQAREGRQLP